MVIKARQEESTTLIPQPAPIAQV